LKSLNCKNNNFFEHDLSFLNHLVNLEELYIGNYDQGKINRGIYNRFHGSLKHLQNLTKLEKLDISNTDISSGVEYLPDSLKSIKKYLFKRKKKQIPHSNRFVTH